MTEPKLSPEPLKIPQLLTPHVLDKKRLNHNEGHKGVKREIINNEGYTREIGSGTDRTGFGDNNEDRAPWMTNLHMLEGPDGIMRDWDNWYKNMPGDPHGTLPNFGSLLTYPGILKQAAIDSYKEQLSRALSRLKESGKIPENVSINDVTIDVPGYGPLTLDQLTEELAKEALKSVQKTEATAPKKESPETAAPSAPAPGATPAAPAAGSPFGAPPAKGAFPQSNNRIDDAIGAFESSVGAIAASKMRTKTGISLTKDRALNKKPDLYEPSPKPTIPFNYTHPTMPERKIPEGDSKYDEQSTLRERHTEYGLEDSDAPTMTIEPNMGWDPMQNYVANFQL